ncbi:ubiquitin-conjugating enzyme E2 [Hamiltosporidium tvaerminnensis]|uniref:Ubiquitin-conjugating enzyme E2 n=2 Tax=Hamiltosporidium TaxID=1176354 RepID=A0A4Q9LN48_9MICR|nr:Ubiquitin-conjugating enzyme E2 15 [Hamiltosporidium tvaerminnensis]TBT97568.1 ubiquitin-conjugating enzyme E2 [Hamiltosporidium tvaerminnensis]TBU07046.1 ubiquitin-conjugating enzyme E2 [Hamiltosporidium magnivora]TBU09547.1 ubiquitin-conjugating enzyme E2 [Hamiltosporidium magnivora]TBU11845.1 ubiquitin-conjugating enzyme E2 [Hamiltosporidium tvaerminnensis]
MAANEGKRSKAFIEKEFKRLQERANEHFSVGLVDDNIYNWEVLVFGPKDTPYENGIFMARMTFPIAYPEAPPTFRFVSEMWHPNIDKDGDVCISILHKPGDDEYGYENLSERWMPVRNPESVIVSIISLLTSPNCESPANLDAAVDFRESPDKYFKKVRRLTQKTLE